MEVMCLCVEEGASVTDLELQRPLQETAWLSEQLDVTNVY